MIFLDFPKERGLKENWCFSNYTWQSTNEEMYHWVLRTESVLRVLVLLTGTGAIERHAALFGWKRAAGPRSAILQARRLAEGQRLARLIAGVQKPLRHRRHKPVTQESDKNWSPKTLWVGFANSTNANAIIYSSLRKCQSARKCSDTSSTLCKTFK